MTDHFSQHLEEASRIVSGWPEWKRNVLGTIGEPRMTSTPEGLAADLAACVSEVSYERMIRRIDRFPEVVHDLIEARAEIDGLQAYIVELRRELKRKDGGS